MRLLFLSVLLSLLLSLAARGQTLPIVVDNSRYFPPVIDQQGPSFSHVSANRNNRPPVANAGRDQSVSEFSQITLDGSASYDPDGDSIYFYQWTFPENLIIEPGPSLPPGVRKFIVPAHSSDSILTFILVVYDGKELSEPDTLRIKIYKLPQVVDNSRWFPPVIDQEGPSCSHVSLIYYLKSAIWNQKFNRDPKLPENQFSYGFVWNQNIDPETGWAFSEEATKFMADQGCATVADFPLGINTEKPEIDRDIREKALPYKSHKIYRGDFNKAGSSSNLKRSLIQELKDSLKAGKCFSLIIPMFPYFNKLKGDKMVYNRYSGMSRDSAGVNHAVTILGYNDTIQTAEGKGAFRAINSHLECGFFYLDYNWFYTPYQNGTGETFMYHFLEEDFSSNPTIALHLKVSGGIKSSDYTDNKFIFTDTTITETNHSSYSWEFWPFQENVDFLDYSSYMYKRNYAQLIGYNGQRLPLRKEEIFFPMNSNNGSYSLLKDLSHLGSAKEFRSASVILFDPISVKYVGDNDAVIYSYTKQPTLNVENGHVKLLASGKKIYSKVESLPDTTYVINDFYSLPAGMHLKPQQSWVHIKSCTSTVKRKLVTFSVDYIDNFPVFTATPVNNLITTDIGVMAKFQFTAKDPENKPVKFSIIKWHPGATINSSTGLFNFYTTQTGTYDFVVRIADFGDNFVDYPFSVKARINQPPVFTSVPTGDAIDVWVPNSVTFQFVASDPEGNPLSYSLKSGTGGTVSPGGLFSFKSSIEGWYHFVVMVSDGKNKVEYVFIVKALNVPIKPNHPPRFEYVFGGGTISLREKMAFTFKANDSDGQAITYSLKPGSLGTINPLTGEFVFEGNQVGIFPITVIISDGIATAEHSFSIKVDIPDAIEAMEYPEFSLSAYPNPVSNQLNIELNLPVSGEVIVEIVDISGKIISTIVNDFYTTRTNTIRYDTSALKRGLYICRLKSGESVRSFKFVKQ